MNDLIAYDRLSPWLRVAGVLLIGLFAWLVLSRGMHAFRNVLVESSQNDEHDKRIDTVMRAFRHLLGILLFAIVLMLIFSELGLSIAPLLGTAGVAGVALGLAAQGIAKDFLAGLALLMDNQLRVGDEVELVGKRGIVESLTIRTVRLRDWDGTVHFVRTGDIGTVTNRSLGYSYAVLELEIPKGADAVAVSHAILDAARELADDPELAEGILGAIEIPGVERRPDGTLVIRARQKVKPQVTDAVRRRLRTRVDERLRAAPGATSPPA